MSRSKEQMVVLLCYLNKEGSIIKKFLEIGFNKTTALSLKATIFSLFSKDELSLSKLHSQGYDGTNNMRGEFNGLKTLNLRENQFAFYIHYFCSSTSTGSHNQIALLFNNLNNLMTVVGVRASIELF